MVGGKFYRKVVFTSIALDVSYDVGPGFNFMIVADEVHPGPVYGAPHHLIFHLSTAYI